MPKIRQTIQTILTGIVYLALLQYPLLPLGYADAYRMAPITNHGEKWRVGYYEGGPYINYPANLSAIAKDQLRIGRSFKRLHQRGNKFALADQPNDGIEDNIGLILGNRGGDNGIPVGRIVCQGP